MAAHESIHDYYLHQHRNIENYLELCLIHPEIELVHELRLSIKKLRAFHKLTGHLFVNDTDEHIRIKNRVRKLYTLAGKLRDTQVQIHMLTQFEEQTGKTYPDYSRWLLRREKKQISRFSKKPSQVVPQAIAQGTHQKIGNLLAVVDEVTILNGADRVLSDFCTEIRDISAGAINNFDLHRIRTITKRMKYIYNIMAHCYPDFKFGEVSIESLREIEVAAGHWHDNLVRVEFMGKFLHKTKIADQAEKFKYQKYLNSCEAELGISFSETTHLVRESFRPMNSKV